MKTDVLEITYRDTTDHVCVRRMSLTERARITDLKIAGYDNSDPENVKAIITLESTVRSNVHLIAGSVIDDDGKPVYAANDVDEWDDVRFNAYVAAINAFQKPNVVDVAKNSTATPSEPSSSTSP